MEHHMKLCVPLLAAAAALCLTGPVKADAVKSESSLSSAEQQFELSSRKRFVKRVYHRRVVNVYRPAYDSYAFAPVGFGVRAYDPYYAPRTRIVGYNPYYYAQPWGYRSYDSYDSYAFAPGPSIGVGIGFGGYGPHWGSGPAINVGFGSPLFW
jgi:hypothetical protein